MGFIDEAIRVLKLTRKPRKDEFIMVSKITGLGMIVIGAIGVLIHIIASTMGMS